MEAFWKWMIRANARAVFGAAVFVLLAVVAGWIWKEFAFRAEERAVPTGRSAPDVWPPLGLLAMIEREASRPVDLPARNPFLDYRGRADRDAAAAAAAAATAASAQGRETPRPPVDPSRPPPPPVNSGAGYADPVPPPVRVLLEFRGLLQASDGGRMALIRADGTPRFFRAGEGVQGFRLEAIEATEARLIAPDGTLIPLAIGVSQTLERPVEGEDE